MRKSFFFFGIILLLFVIDFVFGADSIIQKPVQKPKDRPIQVNTYSGKLCYIPTFL